MAARVVLQPPGLDALTDLDGPLVYLAGPIQGGGDWHREALVILDELAPEIHVASPRATNFNGSIDRQLAWERACFERAAIDGAILAWAPKELGHRCNRPYAAQLRFELGEWAVKASIGLGKLVVGIERGFAGGSYIQRRFTTAYSNIPLCRTLRQTCAVAIELCDRDAPVVVYPRKLEDWFVPRVRVN